MGDSLHKLLLDNDSDDEVPQNRQLCRDSHELTNARHVLLQQQVHVNTHLRVSALTGRKVNLHKAVLSLLHMTMLQTMNSINALAPPRATPEPPANNAQAAGAQQQPVTSPPASKGDTGIHLAMHHKPQLNALSKARCFVQLCSSWTQLTCWLSNRELQQTEPRQ